MSDSNQGSPAPGGEQPFAQPAASSGESPYGVAPMPPPASTPYAAQQPQHNPYGGQQPLPPPPPNPYGSPYYQQVPAGPLGDGLDMYGRPLGRKITDQRPGTVTAAGWITLVFAGLSLLLYGFITLALIVAKTEFTTQVDKAIRDSGQSTTSFSAEDAYGLVLGILLVIVVWCAIACLLAVMVMRRSRISRTFLVISCVVAGVFCLIGIQSIVSGVPLVACIAVVWLLFSGGANQWFRESY